MKRVAKLLVIAGSDSGGGAGVQADIKAASARGVYSTVAITAITAQNTVGVQAVELLRPEIVAAQIASVMDDIGIDAVKIGMLGDAAIADAVADALAGFAGPVVLDPVMVAKSGDALLRKEAEDALRRRLLPMATLLTPNLPEAGRLLGLDPAPTPTVAEAQGRALLALGPRAVLMKGGHGAGRTCVDLLILPEGAMRFAAPRIETGNTHGTGCSYASAIAAELAKGAELAAAVSAAHGWLHEAILAADGLEVGRGHGPVHHFHRLWA